MWDRWKMEHLKYKFLKYIFIYRKRATGVLKRKKTQKRGPQQISWDWSCAYRLGVWDIIYLTTSKWFKEKTLKIEGTELTVLYFVHFRPDSRESVLKSFCGHLDRKWLESNEVRAYRIGINPASFAVTTSGNKISLKKKNYYSYDHDNKHLQPITLKETENNKHSSSPSNMYFSERIRRRPFCRLDLPAIHFKLVRAPKTSSN